MHVLVDGADITGFGGAHLARVGLLSCDMHGRIGGVRRATDQIEFGRYGGIVALERHRNLTHANIESFTIGQRLRLSVDDHATIPAQVDDTQFASIEEIRRAELLAAFQCQCLRGRYCAAENDAVNVRIGQFQFAGDKHLFDKKMAAQRLGVIPLHVFGVMGITDIQFHAASNQALRKSSRCGVKMSSNRPSATQVAPCSTDDGM